jgi:FkbM family methyltransferase
MKDNLDYLQRHIQLNNLENVNVLNAAISDRSGELRFSPHPDRLQGRLDATGSQVVNSITLDEYVNMPGVRPPNFLKIDVEGGEASVLRGAMDVLAKYRPVIFLATHGQEVKQECEELLLNAGYQMRLIGRDPSEWIVRPSTKR